MADNVKDLFVRLVKALGTAASRGVLRVLEDLKVISYRRLILAALGVLLAKKKIQLAVDVCKVLDSLQIIYRWVRNWFCKPEVVIDDETKLNNREVVCESVREGSDQMALSFPKCQAYVGQMKEGKFVAHGCTVRFGNWLVMPDHVFSYAERETARTYVMGRKKESKPVEITGREFQLVDTDMGFVAMSADELSQVGISRASIGHVIPDQGSVAVIVGASGLGTQGRLNHDSEVFGRVVYGGTTVGGYSGAAYCVMNQVVGIHQCGGKINGGYSASYLWVTINFLKGTGENEDTWDWLQKSYKGKKRIEVDLSWKDLDEVRVKVDGQYAIVNRKSMAKAFGANWLNEVSSHGRLKLRERTVQYDDYEAGEVQNSTILGASSSSEKSQGLEGSPVLTLTSGFKKLSKTEQEVVIGILKDILEAGLTRQEKPKRFHKKKTKEEMEATVLAKEILSGPSSSA